MSKINKICIDRSLCIGAATCLALAPDVFALDGENKAVIIGVGGKATSDPTLVTELGASNIDDGTLLLAAQSCPTMAITLVDEAGVHVFPEM